MHQLQLAVLLSSLNCAVALRAFKFLHRGNVTLSQIALMSYLSETKSVNMTDISKKMGHSTAAATGLVGRLEKLGYVKRLHAKNDRRMVLVILTRKGTDFLNEYNQTIGNSLEQTYVSEQAVSNSKPELKLMKEEEQLNRNLQAAVQGLADFLKANPNLSWVA